MPYEIFNKKYRSAQRVLDVEVRHAVTAGSEVTYALSQDAGAGEIDALLGGMVCLFILQ